MILTHAVLLSIAFTVRYNALYYPLAATLAFILSRLPCRWRTIGIILPMLLMGIFIYYTSGLTAAETGRRQFSPFGGWKLANDAIYAYVHVKDNKDSHVPDKFRSLDETVRRYFASPSPYDGEDLLFDDFTSGSFYMFYHGSPLVLYMDSIYGPNEGGSFINTRKWLAVSPLYQEYGSYLIRKYPQYFARYFVWPNFIRYCLPPKEILDSSVSYVKESIGGKVVQQWFGLHELVINEKLVGLSQDILRPYPLLFGIIHLLFFIGSLAFFFFGGFRSVDRITAYCIVTIIFLWLTDLVFSLLAAGIVLRYQIFMMIIESAFGLYFIEYSYKLLDRKDNSVNRKILKGNEKNPFE